MLEKLRCIKLYNIAEQYKPSFQHALLISNIYTGQYITRSSLLYLNIFIANNPCKISSTVWCITHFFKPILLKWKSQRIKKKYLLIKLEGIFLKQVLLCS